MGFFVNPYIWTLSFCPHAWDRAVLWLQARWRGRSMRGDELFWRHIIIIINIIIGVTAEWMCELHL